MMNLRKIILKINEWNWASLTLLTTLWIALFTFQLADWNNAQTVYHQKQTFLKAIQKEISLMSPWAKEKYHSASLQSYLSQNQHFIWYNPSYFLYEFEHPNLQNILANPAFMELDSALIDNLIMLSQRVTSLYELRGALERYKLAFPDLFQKAAQWVTEMQIKNPNIYDQLDGKFVEANIKPLQDVQLRNYLTTIYSYNFRLFVCGIGSDDGLTKPQCGEEMAGLHELWGKCLALIDAEMKNSKTPNLVLHFLFSLLVLLCFVIPSFISFLIKVTRKKRRPRRP